MISLNQYVISDLFPRMWRNDEDTFQPIKSGLKIKNVNKKPTFLENLRYFFHIKSTTCTSILYVELCRVNKMTKQGHGELNNGNWISGINF